uniref:OTU domain-containing protein n=1 Tax=Globodera pallida TaxID=36090 RepID=A0A183BSX7_GLOPA
MLFKAFVLKKAENGGLRRTAANQNVNNGGRSPVAAAPLIKSVSQRTNIIRPIESTTPATTSGGRKSLNTVLNGLNWLVDEICTSIMGEDGQTQSENANIYAGNNLEIADFYGQNVAASAKTKKTEKLNKEQNIQKEQKTEKLKKSKMKKDKSIEKQRQSDSPRISNILNNNSNGGRPADLRYQFNPLSAEEQKDYLNILLAGKSNKYKLENIFERKEEFKLFDPDKTIANPSKVKENQGNGDCLFRSIAYALLGTEELHKEVRQHIANYYAKYIGRENALPPNERWIREMLLIDQSEDYPNFQSIKQYVEYLQISGVTQWGGLVDIVAAAKAFNVNVMLFYPHIIKNDWICYSPDTVDQTTAWNQKKGRPTLFLQFVKNNHYNVILGLAPKPPMERAAPNKRN